MKPLSRRTVLRAGGAAIALPFLNAMGDPRHLTGGVRSAYAADTGFPKRLLICFSSNGTIKGHQVTEDLWTPDASFDFPYILEPLTKHKQDIIVLDGINCQACIDSQGSLGANPHDAAITQLTGRRFKISNTSNYQDAGGGTAQGAFITAGGISVDQEIANRLDAAGQKTKFKSYQMFTSPDPKTFYNFGLNDAKLYIQWAGEEQGVLGEVDPVKSFGALFGDGAGSGPMPSSDPARLIAQKKSILDAALESYNSLYSKVDAEDKALLQKHMDEIRAIENQLESGTTPVGNGCTEPTAPTGTFGAAGGFGTQDGYPQHLRAQTDLMVSALACDLTRVGVLEWEPGFSELTHVWQGHTRDHHEISHDTSAEAHQQLADINNWYASEFSYLLDKLKGVSEGSGTLLDNTAVIWILELSEGATHDHNNQGIIMAGSCGGYFQTGRYVNAGGAQINAFLVSLINAMGFTDVTQFGEPDYASGPLAALTG